VRPPRLSLGDNDWTRVEVEFEVEDQDAVQVNCLLGGWGFSDRDRLV
jgi:hypothetical protein